VAIAGVEAKADPEYEKEIEFSTGQFRKIGGVCFAKVRCWIIFDSLVQFT